MEMYKQQRQMDSWEHSGEVHCYLRSSCKAIVCPVGFVRTESEDSLFAAFAAVTYTLGRLGEICDLRKQTLGEDLKISVLHKRKWHAQLSEQNSRKYSQALLYLL